VDLSIKDKGTEKLILCFFDSRASYLHNIMYCLPAEVNYGTSEFLMYRADLCIDHPTGLQRIHVL